MAALLCHIISKEVKNPSAPFLYGPVNIATAATGIILTIDVLHVCIYVYIMHVCIYEFMYRFLLKVLLQ